MKQKLLSLCPIADKEVEQIIANFYDIDLMSEPTEEKVLAAIEPYDAVIVPYTTEGTALSSKPLPATTIFCTSASPASLSA